MNLMHDSHRFFLVGCGLQRFHVRVAHCKMLVSSVFVFFSKASGTVTYSFITAAYAS